MSNVAIEQTLRQFTEKVKEIRGLILVSETGYPLIQGEEIEDSQPIIMAGRMLQTAALFQEENQWEQLDHLSIRGKEGYFELIPCLESIFLLVYSTSQWSRKLEQEISQLLKQLQKQLQPDTNTDSYKVLEEETTQIKSNLSNSPSSFHLPLGLIQQYQQELAQYVGPIASILCHRTLVEYNASTPSQFITQLAQFIPSTQQSQHFIDSCVNFSLSATELETYLKNTMTKITFSE